jgi:putative ABC transport system ATP-binding protein
VLHQYAAIMIALKSVAKTFETPAGPFTALRGIDLDVRAGEFVAVVGKSGSGKTTLLNLIAGIDRPSSGAVRVGGTSLADLSHDRLAMWRGRSVGVVFQFFQLLPALTAAENVMLPMDFSGRFPARERRARALELLARVGVPEQADKLPATLSGGQQQRVAIARALANDPPLLVADEPTGNLDSATGAEIFRLFASLVADGKTVVVVTHERDTGAGRTVVLADGRIVDGPIA